MSEIEAIHHAEQMDAMRAEFQGWWAEVKIPLTVRGDEDINQRITTMLQIAAWKAYVYGKTGRVV